MLSVNTDNELKCQKASSSEDLQRHLSQQNSNSPNATSYENDGTNPQDNIELGEDYVDHCLSAAAEFRRIQINRQLQEVKFKKNSISTSKYNVLTFLPKFLFEQFQKYSNIFFFFIVMLQQIPDVSPTGRFTTLIPLLFIMGASMIKEIIEDFKRRKSDNLLNNKRAHVFRSNGLTEPLWKTIKWRDIVVGDIVRIHADEQFPCDLFLLASSEPSSICYLQTSNLDGETNLKIRQALPRTSKLTDSSHLKDFEAEIECEQPNQKLYEFTGNLAVEGENGKLPIGPDQILLRGSLLQNTNWVYGVAIFTGHDSKIMMNSSTPPFKRSMVERTTNTQILFLFLSLLVICFFSAVCSEMWHSKNKHRHWYLGFDGMPSTNFPFTFITFIILYNNLIPISLQVTLEFVKFLQAYFINWDEEMYDAESNFYAVARTSNLNEELGQVKYVFSDKTGTLTCNKMEFKRCSVAGICYGLGNEQEFNSYELLKNLNGNHATCDHIHEFLSLLATCHTVIPERKSGTSAVTYQASSPDESALVKAIQKFGIVFSSRQPEKISVQFLSVEQRFDVLNIFEFTSVRKRMSVILRDRDGQIKLYCKGADNVILSRACPVNREYTESTVRHLEEFAKDGFRTLVVAYRVISEEEYAEWSRAWHEAATSLTDRERKCQEVAELIEKNLVILGATAIEDKLQMGVPKTIEMLIKAGIKVWVLTGDKIETAVNIGYSCKLLSETTTLIYLTDENPTKLKLILKSRLAEIPAVQRGKENNQLGLVIDGKALGTLFSADIQESFLELATSCCTVICCRATPRNKAQLVEFIKISTQECTLAIGDGANDVSMIQAAHVGIGIYGCEGTQALSASDYAIGQFRFLSQLLFVHGIWNYKRLCKVILYSYYKNICLYVIELWYAFSNGFSGQILFERWLIGLYNVFFTALPPLALGLFDRPTKVDTMLRFPELYKITQSKSDFNMMVFWKWITNSFAHSMMIYFSCYGALRHDVSLPGGQVGDYLFMGCHVYTYCVIVVCLKSGLETDSWTSFTHLSIWGSILSWFLFLVLYSYFWPLLGLAPEMTYMAQNLFRSPFFWIGMVFVPAFTLLPDVFYKSLQRTMYKTEAQAIQEREAKNEDVETIIRTSKISETARLLKSAFTFTRSQAPPTAYRGFAFSQEENGAVKQSELIQQYDTNVDKPTGD